MNRKEALWLEYYLSILADKYVQYKHYAGEGKTIREYRSNFRTLCEFLYPSLQITPYYLLDMDLIENNGTIS